MKYVTLQKKLKKYYRAKNKNIQISLEDFRAIFDGVLIEYDKNFDFLEAKNKNKTYVLKNFDKAFLVLTKEKITGDISVKCHLYICERPDPVKIYVDYFDLWKINAYTSILTAHFAASKPGDLIVVSQPEVFLAKNFEDVFISGFNDADWDMVLHEGDLVTLLEKFKIGDFCFTKVLYGAKVYWMFGGFFSVKYDPATEKNHHMI